MYSCGSSLGHPQGHPTRDSKSRKRSCWTRTRIGNREYALNSSPPSGDRLKRGKFGDVDHPSPGKYWLKSPSGLNCVLNRHLTMSSESAHWEDGRRNGGAKTRLAVAFLGQRKSFSDLLQGGRVGKGTKGVDLHCRSCREEVEILT